MSYDPSESLYTRPRPWLSMPLALVIAAVAICGTILTIYLVERARERDMLRRATYATWLKQSENFSATMKEVLDEWRSFSPPSPPSKPSGDKATDDLMRSITDGHYNIKKQMLDSLLPLLDQVSREMKASRPPIPE
jgi:hypothetical protein